jgi:nudix-type nucleoside diphosphatase (YffH/AdpP family)
MREQQADGRLAEDDRIVVIHRRNRLFDDIFRIDEVEVTHSRLDGQGFIRNARRLSFERGDSAAALVHNVETDTVVLTEQFRLPTYEKGPGWMIEAIAGAIDAGETPEQCIRREMMEELGFRAGPLEVISAFYASPGGSSERIFLFYAPVRSADLVAPSAAGLAEQQEDIKRISIPRADFIQNCIAGQYVDAKLLIAGLWLAAQGARGQGG